MKPTRKVPTPADLAVFVRARDISATALADPKDFSKAVSMWREWQVRIAEAWNVCDQADQNYAKDRRRVAFSDVKKELAVSNRTLRSYWDVIFPILPADWMDRKISGFPRLEVDQMLREQSDRSSERGRVAAKKKHSKGKNVI